MRHARFATPNAVPTAWLLWAAIVALALLAAYVHLLTSAIERGVSLRQHQSRGGLIATATAAPAAQDRAAEASAIAAAEPLRSVTPIPHSHVALIVVP